MNEFSMILLQAQTTLIASTVEKLTIVGVLAIFLNYFMKELKALQNLRENDKKDNDKKFEEMFSRQFEIEKQNIETITKQSDTNVRLTEAINNLSDRIGSLKNN